MQSNLKSLWNLAPTSDQSVTNPRSTTTLPVYSSLAQTQNNAQIPPNDIFNPFVQRRRFNLEGTLSSQFRTNTNFGWNWRNEGSRDFGSGQRQIQLQSLNHPLTQQYEVILSSNK